MVKNLPANIGYIRDTGSIPGSQRSPGGGNGNLLQYSCLENLTDREAWQATVHSIAQSQTQLKWLSTHTGQKYKWRDFPGGVGLPHLGLPWMWIHLPILGTQVWSLVWEDSTCFGSTKSVCHKYCSLRAFEPVLWNKRNHQPPQEAPMLQGRVAPACHNRKPAQSNKDPAQPKIKK